MEDMQTTDVFVLLAQHEEHRICQVEEFGDVVHITECHQQMFFKFRLCVVVWPAFPCRETESRVGQSDDEADTIQEDEEDIVSKHHPLEVIGLSVLHHRWSPVFHKHVINKEDGKQLPWPAIHERQSTGEWV